MTQWKAVFVSYGTEGEPQKVTQMYDSKKIAEEHARFLHRELRRDSDYAGFTAHITPPRGNGQPYWYIRNGKGI